MKQFIIILITVVILGVLYFFQEDLQKLYYSLLRDFTEEQVSFDKKNEYYSILNEYYIEWIFIKLYNLLYNLFLKKCFLG